MTDNEETFISIRIPETSSSSIDIGRFIIIQHWSKPKYNLYPLSRHLWKKLINCE